VFLSKSGQSDGSRARFSGGGLNLDRGERKPEDPSKNCGTCHGHDEGQKRQAEGMRGGAKRGQKNAPFLLPADPRHKRLGEKKVDWKPRKRSHRGWAAEKKRGCGRKAKKKGTCGGGPVHEGKFF